MLAEALESADGQWHLLRTLAVGQGMKGRQYRGVNVGGRLWTQFCFIEEHGGRAALFYRIGFSARGPYLSLRQYQARPAPSAEDKAARLGELRSMWSEVVGRPGTQLVWEPPRNQGQKELEIAWCLLGPNAPAALRAELPRLHDAFVRRLAEAGWRVDHLGPHTASAEPDGGPEFTPGIAVR